MTTRQENVKWVDVSYHNILYSFQVSTVNYYNLGIEPQFNFCVLQGLRGFASLLVVVTHICRSFDEDLFRPTSAEGASPRIAQLPIIRILFQGRIGVTIFSLVTGYVCALKPIRQFRAGQHEAAFTSIAKSAFRRIPRLVLPTTIATTIIWFICQLGAFKIGNAADSWWLNFTSPNMSPHPWEAVKQLIYHLITTWTNQWNIYDANQWTMLPLLKGSMMIYIMMVGTAYAKAKYRMMVEWAFFIYFYVSNDCKLFSCFFVPFRIEADSWMQHSGCNSSMAPFCLILLSIQATFPGVRPVNGRLVSLRQHLFLSAFFSPHTLRTGPNGCVGLKSWVNIQAIYFLARLRLRDSTLALVYNLLPSEFTSPRLLRTSFRTDICCGLGRTRLPSTCCTAHF